MKDRNRVKRAEGWCSGRDRRGEEMEQRIDVLRDRGMGDKPEQGKNREALCFVAAPRS